MVKLHVILLSLLSLQVTGFRIYKERQALMNVIVTTGEQAVEERIHLEYCQHSSQEGGNCVLAIDLDPLEEWTQCSSTEVEDIGWWKAELETPSYISRVVIYTVQLPDSNMKNALNDFALLASDVECYRHISSESFKSRSFPCDSIGDIVRVQSYRMQAVLSLCEVEVFGVPVTFQGLETGAMELSFLTCAQSTIKEGNGCSGAIDRQFVQYPGNNGKKCAQTEAEDNPWWIVYFTVPSLVKRVKIYNRVDCCRDGLSDFHIKVNEVVCARHKDWNPFLSKIFICERFGSYLQLLSQLSKKILGICQVQVFGYKMLMLADTLYSHIGCFNDNQESPDFEVQVSSTFMSPGKCHKMCKRISMTYFGLQNGQACMCGNKYGRYGKAESQGKCDAACKDDPSVACGGVGVNSVYEIVL